MFIATIAKLRKSTENNVEKIITKTFSKVKFINMLSVLINIAPKSLYVGVNANIGISIAIIKGIEKKSNNFIFLIYEANE
ncbi:MAG: hypothetical protein QW045_00455 [Candidatus Micrarchaeaceae archaeon]